MEEINSSYVARRRKEDFSFMIVRFLKAYDIFNGLYRDFKRYESDKNGFEKSGLFERIKYLEENLVFDIKEKAHFLYRNEMDDDNRDEVVESKYADLEKLLSLKKDDLEKKNKAKKILSELRKSLVNKSIDSYIGTGFHMFMILRESVYQLEFYVPQYSQEHNQIERIEFLTEKIGYELDADEKRELDHIKELDKQCQTIASDTKDLADRALERCKLLFEEAAKILRHSIEESGTNEVLVLNLLKEKKLVEKLYGKNASEEILSEMYRHIDIQGNTGLEKAMNYAKKHCGNINGIPRV